MARRRYGDLDRLLEGWARWLSAGRASELGGSASLLARWMDGKGYIVFGGGGGSSEPRDAIEGRVEVLVYELGKGAPLCADVLRLEYAAGAARVAVSRGWSNYTPQGKDQLAHALLLGVSLRTYRTRLKEARQHVAQHFGVSP